MSHGRGSGNLGSNWVKDTKNWSRNDSNGSSSGSHSSASPSHRASTYGESTPSSFVSTVFSPTSVSSFGTSNTLKVPTRTPPFPPNRAPPAVPGECSSSCKASAFSYTTPFSPSHLSSHTSPSSSYTSSHTAPTSPFSHNVRHGNGNSSSSTYGSNGASSTTTATCRSGNIDNTKTNLRRMRNNVKYDSQRKELDNLMNKVLQLQDEGKFSKVEPHMKRIEQLQAQIESGFEEDKDARRSGGPGASAIRSADASVHVPAPSPSVPKPVPSPTTNDECKKCAEPMDMSATGAVVAVVGSNAAPGTAENDVLSEYSESSDSDELEEEVSVSVCTSSSSDLQQQRRFEQQQSKPRHLSLSHHISDNLLLVGPEEEKEIVQTLKHKTSRIALSHRSKTSSSDASKSCWSFTSSTSFMSTGSGESCCTSGSSPVFVQGPQNKRHESLPNEEKKRHHLSLEGCIWKAPPPSRRSFLPWSKLWFSLNGTVLSYRANQASKTSKLIYLKDAIVDRPIVMAKESKKGKYEVRIQPKTTKRIYRLRFEKKMEALQWSVAILNNIEVARQKGDLAAIQRRKEEKKREEETNKRGDGWFTNEPSRVGEDIAVDNGAEELYAHYKLLELPVTASKAKIKKKYYSMAKDTHPDKLQSEIITRFTEISEAYNVLVRNGPESRACYDLCERVKGLFRQGVLFKLHNEDGTVQNIVMMMEPDFNFIYYQNANKGTILQPGYKYIALRFVQHIFAGTDGFHCPPGKENACLSLRGERLGITLNKTGLTSINLEVVAPGATMAEQRANTQQAREDILDGLRIHREMSSAAFREELEKMKKKNMR